MTSDVTKRLKVISVAAPRPVMMIPGCKAMRKTEESSHPLRGQWNRIGKRGNFSVRSSDRIPQRMGDSIFTWIVICE